MKVKISVIDDKNKRTIKVDASNNLKDILEVLLDNGLIESHGNVVYSKRIGRIFNIERTIFNCGIQNGDELYVNTSKD